VIALAFLPALAGGCVTKVVFVDATEPVQLAEDVKNVPVFIELKDGTRVLGRSTLHAGQWVATLENESSGPPKGETTNDAKGGK
jgi:hypothetical protein